MAHQSLEPESRRASENLAFIRQTMESASTFTAVSGWGLVAAGAVGFVASWIAWATGTPAALRVWVPAALLASAASVAGNALKARRLQVPLWSGPLRKMGWGLVPALLAGAMLTVALLADGAGRLIPGVWLAVYGAGVSASGTFSIQAIRWMGVAFLGLGGLALLLPAQSVIFLAAGFGGVHTLCGLYVVIRHDG